MRRLTRCPSAAAPVAPRAGQLKDAVSTGPARGAAKPGADGPMRLLACLHKEFAYALLDLGLGAAKEGGDILGRVVH